MNTKHNNKCWLMLAVLALAALSCSELLITNNTEVPVRIVVSMPGESGSDTKMLAGRDSDLFMSDTHGAYSISAIPDEKYREELSVVRENISKLLLSEKGRNLPAEEFNKYVLDLARLNTILAEMVTVSCKGTISESSRVFAEINRDYSTSKWSVTCGSN